MAGDESEQHRGRVGSVSTDDTSIETGSELVSALAESERQKRLYETLIASTPDLVYTFDLERRFSFANAALLEMWGRTLEESLGKSLLEIGYEPWHAEMHEREIDQVIASGRPVRGQVPFHHATQGRRIYDYIFVPVFDEAGEVEAVAGTTRDITEYKQAEEEARILNARLEQRVAERTAELEATNAELEAFNYSVSHDLRAPLRSIDGFSQALLDDGTAAADPQSLHYLERIRVSAVRMGELIDDLLDLSRLSREPLEKRPVDLSRLSLLIAQRLREAEPQRDCSFRADPGIEVDGDERLLTILLQNLLENAWKFTRMRERACVEFTAHEQDGEKVYQVRDNGAGFDMKYAGRLFGAFQRLHGSQEYEGTGIGLATVQRVVRRHGGRVWAEAAVDEGAAFYFTLAP